MRRWWKSLGLVAGGLLSLGGMVSSANAQFPPPGGAGYGMPPGGGMMAPPPGMGMPPGMGVGMPPGGGMMGPPPGMGMGMPPGGGMNGPPPGAFANGPAPSPPAEFCNPAQPSQEPATPFSIKDEGMPNAFTDLIDPRKHDPVRWQFSAGYTVLWFKPGNLPALATTGSVNDPVPSALGQPNTAVLSSGPRDPGASSALRLNSVYWLADPEVFSLESNFFIMEQRSKLQSFQSNNAGTPLLSRPFFNPVAGQEDADPRAFPGLTSGSLSDAITSRLMGAEINLKWYSGNPNLGSSVNLFFGGRWMRLDERYSSFDTTTDLAAGGNSTTFSDTFTTYNQFFGPQLGTEWQYRWQRLTFGLMAKLAIGPNYETIKISGQTVQATPSTGAVVTDTQGLFAQPSNVGVYHIVKMAVLPEVGLNLNFDLTDRIRFNVGYSYFLMSQSVRPGDQIDRRVNIQPLLSGGGFPPALPGPPTFQQSSFHAQMLNLALEFSY